MAIALGASEDDVPMSDRPNQQDAARAAARSDDAYLASKRRVAERNEQASKAAMQRRRAFDELRAKLRDRPVER